TRVDGRTRPPLPAAGVPRRRLRNGRRGHPHRAAPRERLSRRERRDLLARVGAIGYLASSAVIAWIGVQRAVPAPLVVVAMAVLVAVPGIAYRMGLRPVAWFIAYPIRRVGGDRWPGVIAGLLAAEHRIGRLLTDPSNL